MNIHSKETYKDKRGNDMTREELITFGERFLKMTKDSKDSISYQFFEEALKLFKQESCTLDDAREDFMFDVYKILDFLPTNNEANQIIDVFDRVTSGLKLSKDCALKKVRAKIEALPKTYPFVNHFDTYVKEDDVKRIIDKYKAESEDKE